MEYTSCSSCNNDIKNIKNENKPNNLGIDYNYIKSVDEIGNYKSLPFENDIQNPSKSQTGITPYNPSVYNSHLSKDFFPYCVKDNQQKDKEYYTSTDPRLRDVVRNGTTQILDRPPINHTVKLKNVYDENLRNYGKNYTDYSSINGGQILYYNDKSIQNAYFEPNFVDPIQVSGFVYRDPMSTFKPQYIRTPATQQPNPVNNTKCSQYKYNLSSITDTVEHRQDLMSKQMSKMNQSRYIPRWNTYNNTILVNPYKC